jgi:hypothetical protein
VASREYHGKVRDFNGLQFVSGLKPVHLDFRPQVPPQQRSFGGQGLLMQGNGPNSDFRLATTAGMSICPKESATPARGAPWGENASLSRAEGLGVWRLVEMAELDLPSQSGVVCRRSFGDLGLCAIREDRRQSPSR